MTVDTLLNQVANPKQIMEKVKGMLAVVNPQFAKEDKKYRKAAQKLIESVSSTVPSAEEYLNALEECYGYELLYVCWQGFQYNLDCFHSPVNALLLQSDFETLHRERRLHTLIHTQHSRLTIDTFHRSLKEIGLLELTDDISSFYTVIETEGYKIAHYFGFLFADRFLPLVVPGYTPDSVLTNTYSMILSKATGFNLFSLENELYKAFFRRSDNE